MNFLLRAGVLEQWAAVLDAADASANDRYVAAALLKNAAVAAEGALPLCQDTGTASIFAMKGESVWTGCDDDAELAAGAADAYAGCHLRHSQLAPLSMCQEQNTGTNLPAQIDIQAAAGDQYRFLFIAKGGGSSNKTAFFQRTKALLDDASLAAFLREQVRALGVAACPPYHLALVVGGSSPEFNLKALKLATAGALDHLPDEPDGSGDPYRDRLWEERLLRMAAESGLGAQFGGRYLAVDARVVRCARHGGSCPVSLGVSCSAIATPWPASTRRASFWRNWTATLDVFFPRPCRCWPSGPAPAACRGSTSTSRWSRSAGNSAVCRWARWCSCRAHLFSPATWPMPGFVSGFTPGVPCPSISASV